MDKYDIGFIIIILLAITATYRFCTYVYFRPTEVTIRLLPKNNIKFADLPLQEN